MDKRPIKYLCDEDYDYIRGLVTTSDGATMDELPVEYRCKPTRPERGRHLNTYIREDFRG